MQPSRHYLDLAAAELAAVYAIHAVGAAPTVAERLEIARTVAAVAQASALVSLAEYAANELDQDLSRAADALQHLASSPR